MPRSLFIAWQDGNTRRWRTVARLSRVDGEYELVFTEGARKIEATLTNIFSLSPKYKYRFKELLAVFKNKIPPKSRAEFSTLARWFGVVGDEDEFGLLAKFGALQSNDPIILYPEPVMNGGCFEFEFFLHSLRYMHADALAWCKTASVGAELVPMLDIKNEADACAVALRSSPGCIILGYVPAFFASDVKKVLLDPETGPKAVISVCQVNRDAPAQMILKCKFSSHFPSSSKPLGSENYKIMAH